MISPGRGTESAGTELCIRAMAYAERGWPVLPCERRGKAPHGLLVPHGVRDASSDPDQVQRWWRSVPAANIGLATGGAFDVIDIDIDGDSGLGLFADVPPAGDPRVTWPTVTTGRGRHVYVAPTGLGNRVAVLPHVDFRGLGGYVVAPPSVHASGAVYSWDGGIGDGPLGPFAQSPPGFERLLQKPEPVKARASFRYPTRGGTYGRGALRAECERVSFAPPGCRNAALNKGAFRLGQLLDREILDVNEVVGQLLVAAARCGLDDKEATRTILSGLRAGTARPRRRS